MPKVEIYYASWCPFCIRAKALLDSKDIDYTLYDVDQEGMREQSAERSGRTSVPQIFIGARHIGGCDDLHALDDSGELNKLLSIA